MLVRAEEVVAALLDELPQPPDRPGGVGPDADDRGVEGQGHGQEEQADENRGADEGERPLDEERPDARQLPAQAAQARPDRRHAGADEELVRREQGHADGDVRPDDAREARRHGCEQRHLRHDADADDPRVPRLSA